MRTDGQFSRPKEQPLQRPGSKRVIVRIVMVTGGQSDEAGDFHKVLHTGEQLGLA